MDDIKIIKELGSGAFGTTYMIKKDGKYYAFKRQKILNKYIKNATRYSLGRELKFYSWINKLDNDDQQFFMKMHDYKIYKCDAKYGTKKNPKKKNKFNMIFDKLDKSKICLDLLLDLKDGTLKDLYIKSKKQMISILIQCIYTIYLMLKSGYIHTDLHLKNIAYKKVNKNKMIKINILNHIYKFKSYGYQISFIDYGLILNNRFQLDNKERKDYDLLLEHNYDLGMILIHLMEARYIFKDKDKRVNFVKKLYENKTLYLRIKNLILNDHPYLEKYYKHFEKDQDRIAFFLYFEIVQYVLIYDKKLLSSAFKKRYEPNFLDQNILEYIKLNMINYTYYYKIIIYLLEQLK